MAKKNSETNGSAVPGKLVIGPSAVVNPVIDIDRADLVLDSTNMRKGHVPDQALIANIAAHGLLMPLLVVPIEKGKWAVTDGGRRLVSINHGIETGQLPKDAFDELPCRVLEPGASALEISMSANLHKAPHPLDTCDAILELAKTEDDEKAIALHFGQTVRWVQQRAALAKLTDKAKQAYRDGRMDLQTAAMMTRLTSVQQDKICKGKGEINDWTIRRMISESGVDSSLALFDWKEKYPPEKIQRSLFDDVALLLDINLFKTLQLEACHDKMEALKAEGYNVTVLKEDDYTGRSKYLDFEGKVTKENKSRLHYLVSGRGGGLEFKFVGPVVAKKDAKSVKKGEKGKADKTADEPTPMTANELTHTQEEILCGHVFNQWREDIISGDASEAFVQFIVVQAAIGGLAKGARDELTPIGVANAYNGSRARWQKLIEQYEDFSGIDIDVGLDDVDATARFETFKKLTPAKRLKLYRAAVASLLFVSYGTSIKTLTKGLPIDAKRLQPGKAFFGRYRTDQLYDYLKRSGVTKESGGMPIDSKKASAVSIAVEVATTKDGWRFGIK